MIYTGYASREHRIVMARKAGGNDVSSAVERLSAAGAGSALVLQGQRVALLKAVMRAPLLG